MWKTNEGMNAWMNKQTKGQTDKFYLSLSCSATHWIHTQSHFYDCYMVFTWADIEKKSKYNKQADIPP